MNEPRRLGFGAIVGSDDAAWEVRTAGAGPAGRLPLAAEMLLDRPSGDVFGLTQDARVLAARPPCPDLTPDPDMPDDTRLWAALQQAGGGTWSGCVYDVDAIVRVLGRRPG